MYWDIYVYTKLVLEKLTTVVFDVFNHMLLSNVNRILNGLYKLGQNDMELHSAFTTPFSALLKWKKIYG